ncbi:MAG: DUF6318 family protein [Bowdeniella nasicola]|nr:DUF6318 family protein [Bowdeniella nasicola]
MDRLFPVWDKPEPPATLTQPTEQGARDAAVYFAETLEYAYRARDEAALNDILTTDCIDCDWTRDLVRTDFSRYREWVPLEATDIHSVDQAELVYEVEVTTPNAYYVTLDKSQTQVYGSGIQGNVATYYIVGYGDGRWVALSLALGERLY